MSTLLIRLAAPLQSWGADSKFEERRATMREPTKSGVIGMLASALGRRREDSIDDLAELKFGVRIDQPGLLVRDYHTAKSQDGKTSYVTHRYYLSDAVFVVGLEGGAEFLQALDEALHSPVFPLFLGRRSCPPVGRLSLGISEKQLEDALSAVPWQPGYSARKRTVGAEDFLNLTVVLDSAKVGDLRRRDMPVSFSQKHRRYVYRYIVDNPKAVTIMSSFQTEHDAFSGVGEGM